jgi:GPH family glycoside/pentoside/hexuronide:cation symporter
MIPYGAGEIGYIIQEQGLNLLLLFYYQQIVGLPGTLTGLALMISMIVDAITDPLIGGWSDRLKSRFGRRHPFILASAIPLGITFILLFSPPDGMTELASFAWLTVFAVLVRLCMTLYYIPHMALGAEMAGDYNQRSTLFAFSGLIGALTAAMTHFTVYLFIFPTTEEFSPGTLDPAGYPKFAWMGAIIMIAALFYCVWGTRKEIPYLKKSTKISTFSFAAVLTDMIAIFKNRNFFILFIASFLMSIGGAVTAVFEPYMVLHFWEFDTEDYGWLGLFLLSAFPAAFFLTPVFTRRFGKKHTLVIVSAVSVILPNIMIVFRLMDVSWFPGNESDWILIIFFALAYLTMLVGPIGGATIYSMFGDIADEHELQASERREGSIYAARAFARKALTGVGTMIGGVMLDIIKFPAQAKAGMVPDDIIWQLGFVSGPAVAVIGLAGIGLFYFYDLSLERHTEIKRQLTAREASAENPVRDQ